MKKLIAFIGVLLFISVANVYASKLDEVNAYLEKEIDLNIDLLAWLVTKHSTSASIPSEWWEEQGGLPWQAKELEKRGFIKVVATKGEERFDYYSFPTDKAAPILRSLQGNYERFLQEAESNFLLRLNEENVIYSTPQTEKE